eukprot:TRINITY_DN6847_c1_g2_i1.p1 TRINITY_DN6847_c1_g2~~TRINITY_DN6847_c1_g2_i1.p1  ORF type:complete len:437 (+),score=97.58 TRINITY_DN6847_c1_g2_i1:39-1313(+)
MSDELARIDEHLQALEKRRLRLMELLNQDDESSGEEGNSHTELTKDSLHFPHNQSNLYTQDSMHQEIEQSPNESIDHNAHQITQSPKDDVIAIVKVDIGTEETPFIAVRRGDDPHELALAFCVENGLLDPMYGAETEACRMLAQMLQSHIIAAQDQEKKHTDDVFNSGDYDQDLHSRHSKDIASIRSPQNPTTEPQRQTVFDRLHASASEYSNHRRSITLHQKQSDILPCQSHVLDLNPLSLELARYRTFQAQKYGSYSNLLYQEGLEKMKQRKKQQEIQAQASLSEQQHEATFQPQISEHARRRAPSPDPWMRLYSQKINKVPEHLRGVNVNSAQAQSSNIHNSQRWTDSTLDRLYTRALQRQREMQSKEKRGTSNQVEKSNRQNPRSTTPNRFHNGESIFDHLYNQSQGAQRNRMMKRIQEN